jgi:2'-5' RNA ligase
MLNRQLEMTARELKTTPAYWLIPTEPAHKFFSSTIADLAARYGAPVFEPHVTVYASRKGEENPEETLSSALARCEPFRLSVRDIQCSDEFTKTVFVRFEANAQLSRLSRALQRASTSRDEYQLDPHLSLIYKEMTPEMRVKVAASIQLPFTEILFNSAKAIVCPTVIRSRKDVEAWRVVATQRLAK